MKTFILYNTEDARSVKNAEKCLNSFTGKSGYEPELYAGCWKTTIPEWKERYGYWEGVNTPQFPSKEVEVRKLATFYSHYSLWQKCVELNEPVVVVEHDTVCIGDLNINEDWDDMLWIQLTAQSMFDPFNLTAGGQRKTHWSGNPKNFAQYNSIGEGVHNIFWRHKDGRRHLAGNTGQITTPKTAQHFIDFVHEGGWGQNDRFKTPNEMRVMYVNPSPIKWVAASELNLSTGRMG